MKYKETVISGFELRDNPTYHPGSDEILYAIKGTDILEKRSDSIPITKELLSKHVLLLGGIGSGKTNTFNLFLSNIRTTISNDDIVVIFDTKGDFYDSFFRPGDIVISNDSRACGPNGKPDYWNLFREVMIDDRVEENVIEMTKTLFTEKIEKSSQPFFPNAAKDLFGALMLDLIRRNDSNKDRRNNESLRNLFNSFSVSSMKKILQSHPDLMAMVSYIDDPKSGQTLGVVAELQQLVREILVGNFAKRGNLSVRETIRNKGGRFVFVEYDLGIGAMLSPVYRLIIDLAIKEALGRKKSDGNVYFIIDEFSLLPKLNHIDNGINFGRSLGAKFIVGLQNVDQMTSAYGESSASSLLSGFSTKLCFKVNDKNSREFVRGLYGENVKQQAYTSAVNTKGLSETVRTGNVIEDKDICSLKVGEAIVCIMDNEPFKFKFSKCGA